MRFVEYLAREGWGSLRRIQRETKLARCTVSRAVKRAPSFETACKISRATGGEVTVAELLVPVTPEDGEAVTP